MGKVVIAGAGPGDPELITIKAANYLQKADVILTDRLVSHEILEQYAAANAEIIQVGKQSGRGSSTPQAHINELMVLHAKQGKLVVRLKGGDISVFSNILDELETLIKHQIPYILIPGITAASGAAAYSGIPLTARKYSNSVRFLTCHQYETFSSDYWQELAQTDDTLVMYMSGEGLDIVVQRLIENGISIDKEIAIIEQATTPMQSVTVFNINNYNQMKHHLASPTLIIIGKVVALHHQFKWLKNCHTDQSYFKPVEGKIIVCEEEVKELLTA
ncbi:MAG TPA: uroporphyrinogen-III C-methyltransferase [Flavisolibacter sp.]|nr:uroporphyrinogen-III C-methyltransferase [Flavisolibacter sp.]